MDLNADIVSKYEVNLSSLNKPNEAVSVNVGLGDRYTVANISSSAWQFNIEIRRNLIGSTVSIRQCSKQAYIPTHVIEPLVPPSYSQMSHLCTVLIESNGFRWIVMNLVQKILYIVVFFF